MKYIYCPNNPFMYGYWRVSFYWTNLKIKVFLNLQNKNTRNVLLLALAFDMSIAIRAISCSAIFFVTWSSCKCHKKKLVNCSVEDPVILIKLGSRNILTGSEAYLSTFVRDTKPWIRRSECFWIRASFFDLRHQWNVWHLKYEKAFNLRLSKISNP